ncbi:MAG TPA: hypothetical protein VN671_12435 [Solirubrobacterales bacterium]|nr:hypothetical protein [Solirubrobacterales bacterium]
MPTARDRAPRPRRRLLPLTVFTAAAIALLAFAGSAYAETKIGEYNAPVDPTIRPEVSILHVSTEYEGATGALSFAVTTAGEPRAEVGGEENETEMFAILLTLPECSLAEFKSAEEHNAGFPIYEILSSYSESTLAASAFAESVKESPKLGFASKEVEGTKTSLKVQNPRAVNQPFTCGAVFLSGVENEAGEEVEKVALFPLTTKPEPPPAEAKPAPSTPETKAAPPAPAPAALSIAKAKKPLKLKVGKWATVKVTVANTGGTTTGPGALRVKAPAGVLVKPERQKVPILAPGGSWTISVRVQLTARAKPKATLALTGTAPGLTAKSSLIVKRVGG